MIGNAIAFAIGAYLYGQGRITIGGVFLLLTYTNLLANKVSNIANQSNDFQQAVVAIRRVTELTNQTSPLQDGPGAALNGKAPSVEFENVSFAYTVDPTAPGAAAFSGDQGNSPRTEDRGATALNGGQENSPRTAVLRNLSFHLAGGQKLGLLGRTGTGKSTIVRLLFRFYDPNEGVIRLDGIDLRQARLSELRGLIGMVTQEVQLFHASARDNLTLFDERISDERIREVLNELGLGNWLRGLPDGLDSVLSGDSAAAPAASGTAVAGAAALSAGEAQLLAMARVFLQDPRLVILDEASSRLDPATEARLERALERLLQDRTAIIIAHRLNTLRKVDKVLVLEEGCLVEYGAREQLEADPESEYHRLLRLGLGTVVYE
ncbi:MAG: ABC transporter ATP-binding protein [Chloroflexi bacterium]|nr:MAG: ABC transporter ATP-binding protein [Chloroflexota bacterium]